MGLLNKAGGWLGKGVGGAIGSIFNPGAKTAQNEYTTGMAYGQKRLKAGTEKARSQLNLGYGKAADEARTGFQTAREDLGTGYDSARSQLEQGGSEALDTARSGFGEAKGFYNTPEMASSRAELYQRILGKGGLSEDTTNKIEGKVREEYGTGLRGTEQSLQSYYGDSGATGLAGENLARAASSLGANRANAVRDIETQNELLKRQEQTGAISSLQQETYQRAGLSSQEAEYVSGLEAKLAEGGANLTAQETNALSQLAAQEGITLADLSARLATGQAGLTSEEAAALADMISGTAANQASMGSKGLVGSILS